ncbi:MAG TPA: deoxyribodipyrimidine photo-lyase [Cellvibrionaceae bacterium]|nr:deoxyribodipyrimidine photo-lyase [Cellvibrionaceae bacterium]
MKIIVWFTQDLRLSDHPALNAALKDGDEVYCIYVFDPENSQGPQGAAQWWLHHSLNKLAEDLAAKGGQLILRSGNSSEQLLKLAAELQAQAIYMTRSYEPYLSHEQTKLYEQMTRQGGTAKRFAGFLLLEPDSILNKQAKPFQVFTPFYRHSRELIEHKIKAAPKAQYTGLTAKPTKLKSEALNQWRLLPSKPNWAREFADYFTPGEAGALAALNRALADAVENYAERRDFPALPGTSCLSAHLHFGEISPRYVLQQAINHFGGEAAAPFTRQLFWREFNYYLLHHYPHMRTNAFKAKFDSFPWRPNKPYLKAWQQGKTGYPIVDAGMRQLWRTGWMHNRVRMICASFLTKHLQIHWQEGEAWFWDTLLDADKANNIGGWQWVAGCGADAAPYFRIFNPIVQGEKFDPLGDYVRTWVPELSRLPPAFIHKPWLAPAGLLAQCGIKLGTDYPSPLVNHEEAREIALNAYKAIQ